MSRFAAAGLSCLAMTVLSARVPAHMSWDMTSESLIQLRSNPDLRMNVKGGAPEPGHGLVLWSCQANRHEQFFFDGTQIKLTSNPVMCLNVEGGVNAGHSVVTWPCSSKNTLGANEEFSYEPATGLIKVKHHPTFCLNIKEGNMALGSELVIWQCESNPHELFTVNDGEIAMRTNPELHLNVAGGDVTAEGAKVVLWNCHAGSHEVFEFGRDDGRIHLQNTQLCLNAESGITASHKIIVWPCAEEPADNELFDYDSKTGVISATMNPNLGFNAVGGAMQKGDEIVLWPVKEQEEL